MKLKDMKSFTNEQVETMSDDVLESRFADVTDFIEASWIQIQRAPEKYEHVIIVQELLQDETTSRFSREQSFIDVYLLDDNEKIRGPFNIFFKDGITNVEWHVASPEQDFILAPSTIYRELITYGDKHFLIWRKVSDDITEDRAAMVEEMNKLIKVEKKIKAANNIMAMIKKVM